MLVRLPALCAQAIKKLCPVQVAEATIGRYEMAVVVLLMTSGDRRRPTLGLIEESRVDVGTRAERRRERRLHRGLASVGDRRAHVHRVFLEQISGTQRA